MYEECQAEVRMQRMILMAIMINDLLLQCNHV